MAIGVRFDEEGFSPVEKIRRVVDAALAEYETKIDARLRLLVDSGVAIDRVSLVYRADCECRGHGSIVSQTLADGLHVMTISECPTCPGICVDGKSIRTPVTRGP